MKRDGKYRYSLQFGAEEEAGIRAGELLEKLGNKKSAVIVAALNDYMDRHPELCTAGLKIYIEKESALRREKLEGIILHIVKEQLAQISVHDIGVDQPKKGDVLKEDIAQMLNNLELFR